MSAKVICFREAKLRLRGQTREAFEECSASANGSTCVLFSNNPKELFELEYQNLISNLKTKNQKYRHPTIMGGYRKTINPIDALYQNLQEVLFKYDDDNEFCVWLVNLFEDSEWLDQLLCDIEEDCINISKFQKKHLKYQKNYKLERLHVLQNMKSNFTHYKNVFKMMEDCRY